MDGKLEVHRGSDVAEVLDRIENGESFALTVGGKAVAQVLPAPKFDRSKALAAAEAIRASRFTLGPGLTIRDLINEGRK